MLRRVAKIYSYAMHPFVIPIYLMVALLFTQTVYSYYPIKGKIYLLWIVALYSLILPILSIALVKRLGRLYMRHFTRRQFYIVSILICAICYLLCAITFMDMPSLLIFRKMAIAALMCEIFCLATIPFSRISLHLTAIGTAVGILTTLNIVGEIALFWVLLGAILAAGLLASARLYMGRNRPRQLLIEFAAGIAIAIVTMLFL